MADGGHKERRRTSPLPFSSFRTFFLRYLILLSFPVYRSLVLSRVPPIAAGVLSTVLLPHTTARLLTQSRLLLVKPHSNLLHNCRVEGTWKRRNGYRLVVGWRQSHLRPRSSKTLDLCHADASATSRLGLSQPVEMARSGEGEGSSTSSSSYCCCRVLRRGGARSTRWL